MADDRTVLRRIAWRELFPWLMIFRCFRLAISLPVFFLATVGTLLMPSGEWLARRLMEPAGERKTLPVVTPAVSTQENIPLPTMPRNLVDAREPFVFRWLPWLRPGDDVTGVYWAFVRPVWRLFDSHSTGTQFLLNSLITLWNIAVWSLFGAAITRMAVVSLGRDERVTLGDALRYSGRNFGWYLAAPLFPLVGVAFLVVPLTTLGLAMRFDFGVLLAGLIWPFILVAGLLMAVLLLGLLGGWPLMWPTISAEEESDAFEAFSRSFSYTFQRPLHYLFYAAIVVLFGKLAWLLVGNFAEALVSLNHWAVSFGSGRARISDVLYPAEESAGLFWAGVNLIHWWDWVVMRAAQAFNFGFFFCTASAIYLLLRRHADQTDFDEVFVPDESTRYGLPPLRPGPEGVPEVGEAPDSASV